MNIPRGEMARLNKLKVLAERGATEGERQAARAAMDRIMAKYGYRRKPAPDAVADAPSDPAAPDPSEMSFEELAAWCRQSCNDINEALASFAKASATMAEKIGAIYADVITKER